MGPVAEYLPLHKEAPGMPSRPPNLGRALEQFCGRLELYLLEKVRLQVLKQIISKRGAWSGPRPCSENRRAACTYGEPQQLLSNAPTPRKWKNKAKMAVTLHKLRQSQTLQARPLTLKTKPLGSQGFFRVWGPDLRSKSRSGATRLKMLTPKSQAQNPTP